MVKLLDEIREPADVKKLRPADLKTLAEEIRQELVETVKITGGHLASSLGAVELAIVLHRVFESPKDKIIWDVGHQAYAHKLLTGRRELFRTQRQFGGLSGFPSRDESPHDHFGTGHASTSISAAMGMAVARDLKGEKHHVVAVIGDGSITGGMAMEGLNNALSQGTRLIVVLNDNGMSISPTVGAFSKILRNVRFDRHYYKATESGKRVFAATSLGRKIWRLGKRLKSGLKGAVMPTMLWEDLGFAYMGPIDGHNLADLESAMSQAKNYQHKSVLVHIITTKGKGYGPAEDDAVCFHGISPQGGGVRSAPSYSQIFARTVQRVMRDDPGVVVITPAMPEGNYLTELQQEFPTRIFDVGICEQHAVTFAAGLATQGLRPVVAIYSTFLQRGFDQIVHDVATQKLPVTFAVDRGGIVGDDGKTHQGILDLSYLSCIPNLVVAAPKDENELQHLLFTAIYSGRPMAVRYPRGSGLGVPMDAVFRKLDIGKGEGLRHGGDVIIAAIGVCVQPALDAALMLSEMGIEAAVLNSRFASPLDSELLAESLKDVCNLVTIEENVLRGGFGAQVAACVQSLGMSGVRVRNIGIPDEYVEHGTQPILRSKYGLDSRGITRTILDSFPELKLRVSLTGGALPGGSIKR